MPRLAEENQAIHEKTVCAMLRFIRNVLLWSDQSTFKGEPELQEVFSKARELLAERPMPHGPVLPRLVTAIVRLLAAAAPNGAAKCEVVPAAAEVLKALLTGPF